MRLFAYIKIGQLCREAGSCAAGVASECPTDLGYRGTLPRGLGRALDSEQTELDPAYVPFIADDEDNQLEWSIRIDTALVVVGNPSV